MDGLAFVRLLSRRRCEGSRLLFLIECRDGSEREIDESDVKRFPLGARHGELAWQCTTCRADRWSLERSRICAKCGAPSPEDEIRMAELKQAMRSEMAKQRPRCLKGRRIVHGKGKLPNAPRAAGAYALDGGTVSAVENAAAAEDQCDFFGVADVEHPGCYKGTGDALRQLDYVVVMLTLGNQGILRDELFRELQPAAVAMAFALTPRVEVLPRSSRPAAAAASRSPCTSTGS